MKQLISKLKLSMLEPISRAVKAENLTYLSHSKLRSLDRCLKELKAQNIDGDYYELGIALGGSAIILAKRMGTACFHGYDVFGMIPPPGDNDSQDTHDRYNIISSGTSSGISGDDYYGYDENLYETVVNNFENHGLDVDGDRVCLHKGLFEDTLRLDRSKRVALAHIDCDWYDPVKYCLETLAPHIVKGGFIVVDDYNDYEGCRKATDQFLEANLEFQLLRHTPHGVIRRVAN